MIQPRLAELEPAATSEFSRFPAPAPLSPDVLASLERSLRQHVSGDVRFDEMTRGLYSTDASIYQIMPIGVVLPKTAADVQAAMRIAHEFQVPVLARGSGTSLSGQTVGRALVVDCSKYLNAILHIDPEHRLVRVQPGVVLDQLNAALKPYGLQFGPDVATSNRANLGGMIGNNSAGSRSVRQGKVVDHVRELHVVLSDGSAMVCGPLSPEALVEKRRLPTREGEIYRELPRILAANRGEIQAKYPRVLRRVSGYNLESLIPEIAAEAPVAPEVERLNRQWPDRGEFNLSKLLVGAEGTLGIVTEAVLHVVPLPRERGVVCLQFASIDAALAPILKILSCRPSAVELLDRNIVELSRTNLKYKKYLDFVEGIPAALLIVEFSGESPEEVADALLLLEQRLAGTPGLEKYLPAKDAAQRDAIWNCRKAGAPLLLSIPGARKPIAFVEDTAVAPARLPDFTRRFQQILEKHGITGAYYGHASVGCLHIRPMLDTKVAGDLRILKQVSDEVAALVREFGGAMTGEHGDGLARSYHNMKLFGPQLFAAFVDVKRLFDPRGLLNPGKVAALPSPIENLRYGTDYPLVEIPTWLDFSREERLADAPGQGFLAAAEMCNGSGVCRKTGTGTMCPSYMATREEEHSTRGRANALRLALTGQLAGAALASPRLYEVFDLCLMCKGCKAECPSNVDVAKLKVEFLAQYHAAHTPALATWIMAQAGWVNRLGSWTAPLSHWLPRIPGAAWMVERLLGIDARRSLPRFARENFQRWYRNHSPPSNASQRGTVVLLDDCVSSFTEPRINQSAVELLEAAGYRVQLAGLWCCGRPFLSKGLVEPARHLAERNIQRLRDFAEQGIPLLGTEPSCLLTLVDEYPDLIPSPATRLVQQHSFLLEDWLATQLESGTISLQFAPRNETALYHGHCQQKALLGTAGARRLLKRVPGLEVREVDSGCCGMAGSFGYDHFDISQQIGRRVLFPAVEQHTSGPVLASGTSCRHQIADGTQTAARHPLEYLESLLRSSR